MRPEISQKIVVYGTTIMDKLHKKMTVSVDAETAKHDLRIVSVATILVLEAIGDELKYLRVKIATVLTPSEVKKTQSTFFNLLRGIGIWREALTNEDVAPALQERALKRALTVVRSLDDLFETGVWYEDIEDEEGQKKRFYLHQNAKVIREVSAIRDDIKDSLPLLMKRFPKLISAVVKTMNRIMKSIRRLSPEDIDSRLLSTNDLVDLDLHR